MRRKLLGSLALLIAFSGSLFAQGTQNIKGTYGAGPPQASNVPGDVGSRYIDTNANVEYICTAISTNGQGVPSCTWTAGGGVSSVTSLPATCTPGVTPPVELSTAQYAIYWCSSTNVWSTAGSGALGNVITNGLMAEYRILPGETAASLIDYSGNGNGAIGTVGTAPTVLTGTGGLSCPLAGAVILPGALNSAKTIQAFVSKTFLSGTYSPVSGNGNGGGGNAIGIFVVKTNGVTGNNGFLESVGNNTLKAQQKSFFGGSGVLTLALDTVDHLYINGKEEANYFAAPAASVGLQTVGSYQLCGSATGATSFQPNYWGAGGNAENVYYALFYNRVLTAAEVSQNTLYLQSVMQSRGVQPVLSGATVNGISSGMAVANGDHVTFDGDSQFAGFGVTTPIQSLVVLGGAAWDISNVSLTAEALTCAAGGNVGSNFVANADYAVDTAFRPAAARNTDVLWGGTNDITACAASAAAAWAGTVQYGLARHLVGWKRGYVSMLSRTGNDAAKNALNLIARGHWSEAFDFFIDLGGTTQLGADGANANATWFQGDGIHPNQNGTDFYTYLVQRAINRFYGNTNFTTATVYGSAAPAAVATTSGSEAGNIVTINFAASNQCLAGQLCTCTGITPTGYNQTYFARTGSATQFTGFNLTSGLGAISVQGTCSAPQQQDADQYQILNFGAGNYTLQTCQGYTGQRIYIKNINAGASTVVAQVAQTGSNTPWTAETIDGAANISVAQNAVLILESQLTSPAAGGCTWKKIQNN